MMANFRRQASNIVGTVESDHYGKLLAATDTKRPLIRTLTAIEDPLGRRTEFVHDRFMQTKMNPFFLVQ